MPIYCCTKSSMWTIFLDNPPHDDLSLSLLHQTVHCILRSVCVDTILLKSDHLVPALFSWPLDVTLASDIPQTNVVYLTGKTGILDLPSITQSVSDSTNDIVFLFAGDDQTLPHLQSITIHQPDYRALIRECTPCEKPTSISSVYMFYPFIDLDLDVSPNTWLVLNSQGYGYESIPLDRIYKRYDNPKQGLFIRKPTAQIIPKILHLLTPDYTAWRRVLPADWDIRVHEIVDVTWPYNYPPDLLRALSVLESEGGIVLPPHTTPGSLIAPELLANPIMCFFDSDYDLDLRIMGSVPKAHGNQLAQIETMMANNVPLAEIKAHIIKNNLVYPTSYLQTFRMATLEPEPIVKQEMARQCMIIDTEAVRQRLTMNPRDLVNIVNNH